MSFFSRGDFDEKTGKMVRMKKWILFFISL